MANYVDLTRTIVDNLDVFPGNEKTNLIHNREHKKHGYNSHRLEIDMHTGTHIDGPMHFGMSNKYLNEFPLEKFIGKGVMLDVRGEKNIKMKDAYRSLELKEKIVLFYTGKDKDFGSEDYFTNNPVIQRDLAHFLVNNEIKMIGLDSSSPDQSPFEIHKIFFKNNVLICENLTNFDKVFGKEFDVIALPLNVRADSSIARVVAVVR
jgi:kynurenine formamidase